MTCENWPETAFGPAIISDPPVTRDKHRPAAPRVAATRHLFWAALTLAVSLVIVKASHIGLPRAGGLGSYGLSLAAISYADVIFAALAWAAARLVLVAARRRPFVLRAVTSLFIAFAAFCCLYSVVNVVLFGILGGFLTYPLLAIIGDVRMVRSSVGAHLTQATAVGLIGVPTVYVLTVVALIRASRSGRWPHLRTLPIAALCVWTLVGHYAYRTDFDRRADRRVAESPYWAIASSTWQAVTGRGFVRMANAFAPDDLADFDPPVAKRAQQASFGVARDQACDGRARRPRRRGAAAAQRDPHRAGVGRRAVDQPAQPDLHHDADLKAEAARSAVVDNFYAHIGRSSNSMVAMMMSAYPKLDFRELTEQYPELPGTSLASMFKSRGYRTAFVTPSDMEWAGWRGFLGGHGFEHVWDYRDLACEDMVSSWGVEDRCMVDKTVDFIAAAGSRDRSSSRRGRRRRTIRTSRARGARARPAA